MHRFEPTRTMTSDCFEIVVGVGRGVEAERLLVSHDRGGHALPRVAVAVQHAHAELGEAAEQRHFLGGDLAGAEKGDGVRAVLALDRLEPLAERRQRRVPVDAAAVGRDSSRSERRRGAVGRFSTVSASQPLGQAMPRLTGYAVSGVRLTASPSSQMHLQPAAGRAKAADHRRRGVGRELGRNLAQAESAGRKQQLARELPVPLAKLALQLLAAANGPGFFRSVHACVTPGMRGPTAAAKNKTR